VPITPHDASGPINVIAGAHVMMTVPNFYRIETSRYDLSKYNQYIDEPINNSDGRIKLTGRPGLGIEMNVDYLRGHSVDGFDDRQIGK
jgi:galactonate dehydratase